MSRLYSAQTQTQGLGQLISKIRTTLKEGGSALVSSELTDGILSLESLDDSRFAVVARQQDDLRAELKSILGETLGISQEAFSEAQLMAGAVAMSAHGNPVAYAKQAYSNMGFSRSAGEIAMGVSVSGTGIESFDTPALESFDESEIRNHLPWSVALNVLGARQDEFGEAFFRTVVITPDQAGIDVSVRRSTVYQEVRHPLTGVPVDFDTNNLVEAVIDYKILSSAANRIYPLVVTSGGDQNTSYYVASGDVAPATKEVEPGITVLTAPLKVGIDINLLGLSQRTDIQTQGNLNSTDAIDPSLRLQTLYLKVVSASNGTSVIPFDVSYAPRNQYIKSVEGRGREVYLNYVTKDLSISGLTKDVAGADAGALAYLDGARSTWTVRLGVKVTGNGDLEFGTVSAMPGTVTIEKIYSTDAVTGAVTDLTATEKAGLAAALGTMTIIGYDLYATRCNANLRTRGQLLNSVEITERHTVKLGAPITIPSPTNTNREAGDLATLINAVRIRNSNNAVTALQNYGAALKLIERSVVNKLPTPDIEGIARFGLRSAFYEEKDFDVVAHLNSVSSHDRSRDVQQAIINVIREIAYRAVRDSGYQAYLDAATGNSGEKPTILIGTDPIIARYLIVDGDTRTLGIGFDHEIVVSQDYRVYNKIYVTLVRKNSQGVDPLSFGNFIWMPELASTMPISRGGATTKEVMVQPRTLHVVHLPILGVISVSNLKEAVTKTQVYQTHAV